MRADMNKLLCERERTRSWDSHHSYRTHDHHSWESGDEPVGASVQSGHRESMKYRYRRSGWDDSKSFSENLNPLYGWVRSNVGRRWNKVYSELCATFNMKSTINDHIMLHLKQYVEIADIKVVDGKLFVFSAYSGLTHMSKAFSVEYYVDPRDGILKRNKHHMSYGRYRRQRNKQPGTSTTSVVIEPLRDGFRTRAECIDQVWYGFKERAVTQVTIQRTLTHHDGTIEQYVETRPRYRETPEWVQDKRWTLSKKEIRKYKLV